MALVSADVGGSTCSRGHGAGEGTRTPKEPCQRYRLAQRRFPSQPTGSIRPSAQAPSAVAQGQK